MIFRILFSLILVATVVQADELGMRQLLELMEEANNSPEEEPLPVETPSVESVTPAVPETNTVALVDIKDMPVDVSSYRNLGLEQIVSLAQVNDARLAPYASALKLAQYRSGASIQRDNPELRVGTELGSTNPDLAASVRFFPLHPWETRALKRENSALVEEEAAALQTAMLETMLDAMTTYHELQCLEKEKALYDRLAEIKKQTAERLDRQVDAAVSTQAQGLLAHWDAQETLESRRNAEIKFEQSKQALAAMIGCSSDEFSVQVLSDRTTFKSLDAAQPTHTALGSRPELQSLRAQRSAADARLSGATAASIPWLNFVEVGYRNNDRGWALEAGFDLPFFSIGGTDKMLAYEELALRNIEVDTQEQMIRIKVNTAVKAYNVAVSEWTILQDGQQILMGKTREYLANTPANNPQQLEDRLALEEKLIRAEFKMLDVRRSVNSALLELIAIVGKPL